MNLSQVIASAISFLSIFARFTATTIDDKALEGLQALQKSPEFLGWLEGLLPQGEFSTLDVSALSVDQIAEGQRLAAAAGVDWSTFVNVLLPILVEWWRNRRQAA